MEIFSLVLTLIGLGISGWALVKAESAKAAVERAVGSRNFQDDLERLQKLISALVDAKISVTPWVTGMPQDMRIGRNQTEDLAKLNQSVDSLRTQAPLGASESLKRRIAKSAKQLDDCFRNIAEGQSNEDFWKAAQSELQLIIPRLEQEEREMKDRQIKGD